MPKPLPPVPALEVGPALQQKLEIASLAIGRLDGIGRFLPDADSWMYSYVRKEAVLSSQIEGTQSSLSDLLLHEHKAAPAVPLDDVREVSNYVAAMSHGVARMPKLSLSLRLVREVQRVLVTGTRGGASAAGEFRKVPVWIGGSSIETATFVPPPPNQVQPALGALETFIHETKVPALIKAGLVHAQFETIHPFLDGNGRVGRILIPLVLMLEGALERPWLYVSLYFKRHRSSYYEALQRVRTHGDWEGWIAFFLDGIAQVADEGVSLVDRLMKLFEKDRVAVAGSRAGSIYQQAARSSNLEIFDQLRKKMAITIPETAAATGISKPTVARALQELERLRIAREITGKKRDRVYVYAEYVAILNQDA
ncbi:MAG TPA: Fic family protein [Kofleriaceae bacterium]|nr:Fic family protein [Kofleriaceae bacterium]